MPAAPGARQVQVRVFRAALNPKDALFRKGRFRLFSGARFPKSCGLDFAGEIAASNLPGLRVGDRVFGALNEWRFARGTLAEHVVIGEDEVSALPEGVSFDEGAAVALAGLTALQALRDVARISAGAEVLINGASGGVGTVAIQIARLLGARVTSVSSATNLKLCADLGAELTLDYESGDFLESRRRYDCVFDVFGNLAFARARPALKNRGVFVSTVPSLFRAVRDLVSRLSSRSERLVVVKSKRMDLEQLAVWLARGELRAVIDSRYKLEDAADAFRRLESKRTRGKLVIEIA